MSAIEQPQANSDFRARLLAGLAASIREKGLHRTQISDIVRHAHTSRRTFYECFADKESCFVELVEASNELILSELGTAVDPSAEWHTQVDQAVDGYLAALAREPTLTVTISRELPALGARGAALLHDGIERYAQLIVALVESARPRDGTRAAIALEEAVMLAGGVSEMLDRAIRRGEDVRVTAPVIKDVFKAVLDPARRR